MAKDTKISWATDTFSTHWGCTEVPKSEACTACYAREFSKRLGFDLWGNDKPRRFFGDKHWNEPRKWEKIAARTGQRRRIFVNSMSDTFEGRRDLDPVRERLWNLIPECPNCDFLLLTKRPQNILRMVPPAWLEHWPESVWVGTTAENQQWADIRLPFLERIPARITFVSAEPLLGPITLTPYLKSAVRWCITGAESGASRRAMNIAWVRALRDECVAADVPFFLKQADVDGRIVQTPELDGRKWQEYPQTIDVQNASLSVASRSVSL